MNREESAAILDELLDELEILLGRGEEE